MNLRYMNHQIPIQSITPKLSMDVLTILIFIMYLYKSSLFNHQIPMLLFDCYFYTFLDSGHPYHLAQGFLTISTSILNYLKMTQSYPQLFKETVKREKEKVCIQVKK